MESGELLDALEADFAAGAAPADPIQALSVLSEHWPSFAPLYGPGIRALMDTVAGSSWQSDPWLVACYGASYRSIGDENAAAGLTYLTAAESLMTENTTDFVRLSVRLRRAAALRDLGRLDEALVAATSAAELLDVAAALTLSERIQIESGIGLHRGAILYHLGDLDGAHRNLLASVGLAPRDLLPGDRLECLAALALVSYSLGDFDGALSYVASARSSSEASRMLATGFGAPALIAELLIAVEQDRIADATALAEQVALASAHSDWAPMGHYAQGAIAILSENYVEGLEFVGRCVRSYSAWHPIGPIATICEGLRATLLLRLGETGTAWDIFASLRPTQHHSNCPARFLAHLRFTTGDAAGAVIVLKDCEALGDLHSARTMVDVQLLLAASNYQLGNTATADLAFDRAMRLAARNDMRIPFRLVPDDVMRSMIARAGTRGQSPAVRSLFGLVGGAMRASLTGLPQLSEREREIVRLMVRDLSANQMADELFVSINTVKSHLKNIYRKFGVQKRAEAIKKARDLGFHV